MFPQEVADRLLQTMAFHGKTNYLWVISENILLESDTAVLVYFLVKSDVAAVRSVFLNLLLEKFSFS